MKSLKNYILEMVQHCEWETVTNKNEITLERIQSCIGHSSFMDERSWGTVDGTEYLKLGKNKWQAQSNSAYTLSGTITDKEMFNVICNGQEIKLNLLVKE